MVAVTCLPTWRPSAKVSLTWEDTQGWASSRVRLDPGTRGWNRK